MDRRTAMLVLGTIAAMPAQAQALPVVVFASNRDAEDARPYLERFRTGMAAHGYAHNVNYILEARYAMNEQARIVGMLSDAVAARPAVIVVGGLYAARALRDMTKTVPVVVATGSDLVEAGIVKSYNRPGGNITGVSDQTDESSVKRLELIKAALPDAKRVGVILNPEFPATPKIDKMLAAAAPRLGLTLSMMRANDRASLLAAIDGLAAQRPDALLPGGDNNTVAHQGAAIARANALRVPIVYFWPGSAEMGAFFSYEADVFGNFERAASHVARILKGSKPGDLPVELPNRYELVVNRKTATALGITLPGSFLVRADRVID
jgi:putative tryptophan/tyrosine transport system substrate-binding protein